MMAALATFIGTIFSSLLAFFAVYFVKRVAVIAAIILILTASAVAFAALIQSQLDLLTVSYPSGSIALGLSLLPSNTDVVVSVIITTHVAAYAHNWFIRMVQARNF